MGGIGCKHFCKQNNYYKLLQHVHASFYQAEDDLLRQALALEGGKPKTHDMRLAIKAARRARHNARKLAAKRYDDLALLMYMAMHAD